MRRESGYKCMECGYKFRTVRSAERAAFGDDGCPKCTSTDIDLDVGEGRRALCLPPERRDG